MVSTRRVGRMSLGARAVRALVAGGLVLALIATPTVADADADDAADEVEEEDPKDALREAADEAREQLRSASRDLATARSSTRAARATGSAADGSVRHAEEQVVPALIDRQEAEEQLQQMRVQVGALRRELRVTREELAVAQERLADRVVRAYKHGSVAADTALPLLAAREASSPGELAQVLKDLEVLALTGATEVDDLIARIVRLEAELVIAVAARADAQDALGEALTRVRDSEEAATARRRSAADAEARLLAAIERELAAERARDEARERLDAALIELGSRSDDEVGDEDDDEDEDSPADHLRGRQRAHARQVSLPLDRRRTSDEWVCPVEGSRFINDWAFPRSQDRKHEGTDVFAPTGTPIVAVTDGVVVRMTTVDRYNGRSGFGGLTVSYEQGDERFYNAHLDAIHPDMEVGHDVAAGDVIGWVGRTGNARGTPPHLHLGWYVDDVAVNPYGSLAVACHGTGEPDGDTLADDVEELTDVMSELRQ